MLSKNQEPLDAGHVLATENAGHVLLESSYVAVFVSNDGNIALCVGRAKLLDALRARDYVKALNIRPLAVRRRHPPATRRERVSTMHFIFPQ